MTLKFHFLYAMTHRKALKLRNCAVVDAVPALTASRKPFTVKRESIHSAVVVCPVFKGLCLIVYTNLPLVHTSSLGTSFSNALANVLCSSGSYISTRLATSP